LVEPSVQLGGDVPLVRDDQQVGTVVEQARVVFEYSGQDLAFVEFRVGEGPSDR
jgi:hypothetical protein